MTCIITLAGPAKVGKTTTAKAIVKILQSQYNLKITHYAFAEPLYDVCSLLTGIPKDILSDTVYKETVWTEETAPVKSLIGWTPRQFLQKVGTEGIRENVNYNFWVETAIRNVKDFNIVIFADGRFENEFEASNLVIEIQRYPIKYACNHASSMPPDPKNVDITLDLNKVVDFNEVSDIIFSKYVRGN